MSKRRKRLFTVSDYLTLGLALGLAFAVWLTANLSRSYSNIMQVPVRFYSNIPEHDSQSLSNVSVAARCKVSGFKILFGRFHKPDVVELEIDAQDMHHFSGNRFYTTSVSLEKHFNSLFRDAKLERFITDTVFVDFPAVYCRKLPVVATAELSYADQYTARMPLKLSPDSVLVYGNEEIVESMDAVYTNSLVLRDLNHDAYGEVALEPIEGLRYGTDVVNYSARVARFVQLRMMASVEVVGAPEDVSCAIYPTQTMLTMLVTYPMVHRYDNMRVVVDYNDILSSRSGKCMGFLEENSGDILNVSMTPEVFECRVIE